MAIKFGLKRRVRFAPNYQIEMFSLTDVYRKYPVDRPLFQRIPMILVTRPTLDFIDTSFLNAEKRTCDAGPDDQKATPISRKLLEPNKCYTPRSNFLRSASIVYCDICHKYCVVTPLDNKPSTTKKKKLTARLTKRFSKLRIRICKQLPPMCTAQEPVTAKKKALHVCNKHKT